MTCKRLTEVDGEPLKVHIQDTSDKVSFKRSIFKSPVTCMFFEPKRPTMLDNDTQ